MLSNRFLFHVGPQHFPGYKVTAPFYILVAYEYYLHRNNDTTFVRVLTVEMNFKAIQTLKLSHNLAGEIEIAARQHLTQVTELKSDDIQKTFGTVPKVDADGLQ